MSFLIDIVLEIQAPPPADEDDMKEWSLYLDQPHAIDNCRDHLNRCLKQ